MNRTLVWFRNDLRIHDHEALFKASEFGEILPVYCFDERQFQKTEFGFSKTGAYRAQFLRESIQDLRERLQEKGSELIVRFGKPEEIIPELFQAHNINQVFAHKEVTKEETDVEEALSEKLGIPIQLFWGSTLYHIDDINFTKTSLPDVFTAFRKKIEKYSSVRELIPTPTTIQTIKGIETGIPFIDANMSELNATGFMCNRGRQNVASFLAQNLNIDWRMGAAYFKSLLLDYDPCSNYGNWAYNSTVGHDPRNRYFNILGQAERYDKNGEFVRYWLRELKFVSNEFVHKPHTIPPDQQKLYEIQVGIDYPKPIIDLDHSYEEIKNRE